MKMRNRKNLLFVSLLVVLALTGCMAEGGTVNEDNSSMEKKQPVYGRMIESVSDIGLLTGVKAPENTLEMYGIGGTDLGIPYYDDVRKQMYFLFGDTFDGINSMQGNWRSQTVGITTDLDASDGVTFDSFISGKDGKAVQIIDSMHDANSSGGERTCIPTGGIAINGTHYVFYMSIREWLSPGWDVNFCAVAKSTDGQNFEVLTDLYWAEDADIGQANASLLLEQQKEDVISHATEHFLQIFPYRVDDYVYIFGIPNGRFGGVKLGRVLVEDIELFEKYEYYCGVGEDNEPIWIAGSEGLLALKNNDDSYIVEPTVGEFSVCYNEYLGKYVMSYYSFNKIIMRTSSDLINWDEMEIITTSAEYVQLYGGFAHELYMEQNGKVMYFYVSQYMNTSLGDEGYNVRILKVTFK